MSSKTKVVDLVMGEDGTYSERGTSSSKSKPKKYPKHVIGSTKGAEAFKNNKDTVPADMDEFFKGIDSGLDFVEGIRSRVGRFMDLRD